MKRCASLFVGLAVLLLVGCDTEVSYRCLSFADVGFGPVRETWRCYDRFEPVRTRPLVTLLRLGGGSDGFGEVSVAGTADHPASFLIQGISRRWNFGCDEEEGAYPFSFVIEPDGTGLYYDFTASTDGRADPRDFYDCVMAP